jgi:hypothetical protein
MAELVDGSMTTTGTVVRLRPGDVRAIEFSTARGSLELRPIAANDDVVAESVSGSKVGMAWGELVSTAGQRAAATIDASVVRLCFDDPDEVVAWFSSTAPEGCSGVLVVTGKPGGDQRAVLVIALGGMTWWSAAMPGEQFVLQRGRLAELWDELQAPLGANCRH